jgi:hypothetical protein
LLGWRRNNEGVESLIDTLESATIVRGGLIDLRYHGALYLDKQKFKSSKTSNGEIG